MTEETEPHVPLGDPTEEANRARPRSLSQDNNGELKADEGRTRLLGKVVTNSEHVDTGIHIYMQVSESHQGDTSGPHVEACNMDEGHQALGHGELDNLDDWACPIMDELASED